MILYSLLIPLIYISNYKSCGMMLYCEITIFLTSAQKNSAHKKLLAPPREPAQPVHQKIQKSGPLFSYFGLVAPGRLFELLLLSPGGYDTLHLIGPNKSLPAEKVHKSMGYVCVHKFSKFMWLATLPKKKNPVDLCFRSPALAQSEECWMVVRLKILTLSLVAGSNPAGRAGIIINVLMVASLSSFGNSISHCKFAKGTVNYCWSDINTHVKLYANWQNHTVQYSVSPCIQGRKLLSMFTCRIKYRRRRVQAWQ